MSREEIEKRHQNAVASGIGELIKYFPFRGFPYHGKFPYFDFGNPTGVTDWKLDHVTEKSRWSSKAYTFSLNNKHFLISYNRVVLRSRTLRIDIDGKTMFKAKLSEEFLKKQGTLFKPEEIEAFIEGEWIEDLRKFIFHLKDRIKKK
jgi:hypothetical protein